MVEWPRDVVMVKVVEVAGVVEVHQWLGHLPEPFLPLQRRQLWLLGLSN